MELYFLDRSYKRMTDPIDTALSVVWSHRFFECGTFRVIFPPDAGILAAARSAYFIATGADEDGNVCCGRIEYIGLLGEEGLEVSGRMLECILCDRVIVSPWNYTGTVSDAVFSAVVMNQRGLYVNVAADSDVIPEPVTVATEWDELADWIYRMLRPFGASFTVTLDVERGAPLFRIVTPKKEASVVFSGSFENIAEVEYEYHCADLKNAALVEGNDGTVAGYDISNGGERREIYRKAADIRPEEFADTAAYREALQMKGRMLLAENTSEEYITCSAATDSEPRFGTDYRLGDPCYVDDAETGISVRTTVTEADEVWENGMKVIYPAFGGRLPGVKNKLKQR